LRGLVGPLIFIFCRDLEQLKFYQYSVKLDFAVSYTRRSCVRIVQCLFIWNTAARQPDVRHRGRCPADVSNGSIFTV